MPVLSWINKLAILRKNKDITFQVINRQFRLSTLLKTTTLVFGAYLLIQQLYVDVESVIVQDASHYLVVGRAILNGFRPYIDLMEVKPPGIFLISALSLALGGLWFIKSFYTVSYIIPCLWRKPLIICLALFGSTATFGSLQPEAFGFLFGFLYVVNLFHGNKYLGGILLALCVGMKEPFLLSLMGAFLLSRRPLKEFVVHIIIAGAIGLLVLMILGSIEGYFDYLDIIFTKRISGKDILLLRGFNVYAIGKELEILGLLLGTFWIIRYPKILLIGIVFYFTLIFIKMAPLAYMSPLFWIGSLIYFYGVYCLRYVDYRHSLALYLFVLATSIAGSAAAHHFIMGFPIFFALILSEKSSILNEYRNSILALIFFLTFSVSAKYTSSAVHYLPNLDTAMDDCNIEQFLLIPSGQPFMNKHSPIGPVFSSIIAGMVGPNHELMIRTRENATQSRLVVVNDTKWNFEDVSDWIQKYYTNEKPACASVWNENWYYRL